MRCFTHVAFAAFEFPTAASCTRGTSACTPRHPCSDAPSSLRSLASDPAPRLPICPATKTIIPSIWPNSSHTSENLVVFHTTNQARRRAVPFIFNTEVARRDVRIRDVKRLPTADLFLGEVCDLLLQRVVFVLDACESVLEVLLRGLQREQRAVLVRRVALLRRAQLFPDLVELARDLLSNIQRQFSKVKFVSVSQVTRRGDHPPKKNTNCG